MTAAINTMLEIIKNAWTRFMQSLEMRNQQQVAAWGASLQYKRRYTNPDDAKAYRRPLEDR